MKVTATALRSRSRCSLGAAAAAALALSACGIQDSEGTVDLDYWLWDANQLLPYQECIDAFEQKNPDINVRISQYGFDDYWTKLTAGFVAGTGPDVFTDHLARYGEYVQRDLLLDLDTQEATSRIQPEEFQEGLADLWTGPDGNRYGMPKDFDAVGLFYDTGTIEEAGLDPDDLKDLDWNPEDGGTFEEVIARLSVDANGVRGDEEGFDPDNVAVYGLASNGSGGADGQTQWSWLAGANGWAHTNADVWGDEYNFDDPALHETLDWYFGLVEKGFLAPYEEVGTDPNLQQQLGSGQAALAADGSWMVNTFAGLEGIDLGIAPVPSGPAGHPVSMYNGLADSISAQSENPAEAAELVAYLASTQCQNIVADAMIVFPARPESTDRAAQAFAEQGIDVSPFTDLIEEQNTLYFPVTDQFGSINSFMEPIMDEIYIGNRDPETLIDANERVNSLLED
ncbi:ABC transporter substrate-binding protein [Nesterenkonia cremea]|uniref:Sugar ABC transporter substrate-binding protein n=1 Tax=Nesterenkonia cremea TaxID=1882340 RepID=A0A917APH8_9MICC|nr:sugar ABC transporter substrate-binding protein [Nesterenkonia cremea]GGE63817.1 sugar ABC transporter substrate-binding protein [Nesterenkonia cremea]